MSERKISPQERYDKKYRVSLAVKLNRRTDSDILDYLDTVKNVSGLVKSLLREHINKEK